MVFLNQISFKYYENLGIYYILYYLDIHQKELKSIKPLFLNPGTQLLFVGRSTSLTVSQSRFKAVSESLLSISPHTLSDQKKVFDLLNEVNTVSARISFSYVMNK